MRVVSVGRGAGCDVSDLMISEKRERAVDIHGSHCKMITITFLRGT